MNSPKKPPLQRGWHNVYDLHSHFVLTVKYRRALLDAQVTAELIRISQEFEERYEIQIECLRADRMPQGGSYALGRIVCLGADRNHVHLLCAAPPKLAPSNIAGMYKSITARELFKTFPWLKKELWGGALWSSGLFVATAGQRGGYAAITHYIKSQGQTPEQATLRLLFEPSDESGRSNPG